MAGVNPTISVITLSVSGLKHSIKSPRLSEWFKKRKKGRNLIQLYAVYKRHILDSKIQTGRKLKDAKRCIMQK